VRDEHFRTLEALIRQADTLDMVLEVTIFSHEKMGIPEPRWSPVRRHVFEHLRKTGRAPA